MWEAREAREEEEAEARRDFSSEPREDLID